MTILKGGVPIVDINDWRDRAGPKDVSKQWVDGRSAKELARAWLGAGAQFPTEVADALFDHPQFGPVLRWHAEPEVRLRFDRFLGEPRNTDLLVIAEDRHGTFLMAVEGKADEAFGETIGKALLEGLEVRAGNPRSRRIERILQLSEALFPPPRKGAALPRLEDLRYQLLTATAGAVCEAERRDIDRVLLLVHEFVTDRTADENHARNARDSDLFVGRLTLGSAAPIRAGEIAGLFRLPGTPLFDPSARLYVAKVHRRIRRMSA